MIEYILVTSRTSSAVLRAVSPRRLLELAGTATSNAEKELWSSIRFVLPKLSESHQEVPHFRLRAGCAVMVHSMCRLDDNVPTMCISLSEKSAAGNMKTVLQGEVRSSIERLR